MNANLTPYLMLDGNAREAAGFYAEVFDAEIESMDFLKDWPQEFDGDIPEGYEDSVIHAYVRIGSLGLMLADIFPGQLYEPGSLITIMVDVKETGEAETLFERLSDGGDVIMPISETSFSPAYAQVKDKYGIEWQILTDSSDMD